MVSPLNNGHVLKASNWFYTTLELFYWHWYKLGVHLLEQVSTEDLSSLFCLLPHLIKTKKAIPWKCWRDKLTSCWIQFAYYIKSISYFYDNREDKLNVLFSLSNKIKRLWKYGKRNILYTYFKAIENEKLSFFIRVPKKPPQQ